MGSHVRTDLLLLAGAVLFALAAMVTVGATDRPRSASDASGQPGKGGAATAPREVRLGFFPNITHAQALLGTARGDFQRALGSEIKLTTATFNAGPSVIEALFAGHIDFAYIGPSPAINGYLRSEGEALRVISGAANNGILVIGSKQHDITRLDQLPERRIATPQYANTQDISCKYYLTQHLGARLTAQGGVTDVIPMANPDIEILMEKGQIDAAWVPEPWGSRMIHKGLANLIAEEKDLWPSGRFPLTSVIVRKEFLDQHPDLVRKFLQIHISLTQELNADAPSLAPILNRQLKKLTGKTLPEQVILDSLRHTEFSTDPNRDAYNRFFEKAKTLKLIRGDRLDISGLVTTGPLEAVSSPSHYTSSGPSSR